jgi:3-phosphoshikimate 1-carboxyvinyltransferase
MISLQAIIDLPASKSISNRVLIIQSLCEEKFEIDNLSQANDTLLLQNCLASIQEKIEIQPIQVEDAGTPFRFLTAYLSTLENKSFLLSGTDRMNERPIASLVDALNCIGANILYSKNNGFPPLLIKGKKLQANKINIDSSESSQFVSALCLIAPILQNGLIINLNEKTVSASYIEMTLSVMRDFGIEYQKTKNEIIIPTQKYSAKKYGIENDWSSACFFYAVAMIADNVVITLKGLQMKSCQGDAFVSELCQSFGIETTFENNNCIITKTATSNCQLSIVNLKDYPDLAIPFIVACAIKYPSVQIIGIAHLVHKESNRILALQNELQKVHIFLHYENDTLTFENKMTECNTRTVNFNSYNDHRIVMSLNLFSLLGFTLHFDNNNCVKKSFPHYWEEFEKLNATK